MDTASSSSRSVEHSARSRRLANSKYQRNQAALEMLRERGKRGLEALASDSDDEGDDGGGDDFPVDDFIVEEDEEDEEEDDVDEDEDKDVKPYTIKQRNRTPSAVLNSSSENVRNVLNSLSSWRKRRSSTADVKHIKSPFIKGNADDRYEDYREEYDSDNLSDFIVDEDEDENDDDEEESGRRDDFDSEGEFKFEPKSKKSKQIIEEDDDDASHEKQESNLDDDQDVVIVVNPSSKRRKSVLLADDEISEQQSVESDDDEDDDDGDGDEEEDDGDDESLDGLALYRHVRIAIFFIVAFYIPSHLLFRLTRCESDGMKKCLLCQRKDTVERKQCRCILSIWLEYTSILIFSRKT